MSGRTTDQSTDVFPTISQLEEKEIQELNINTLEQNGLLRILHQKVLLEDSYGFVCERIKSTVQNGKAIAFATTSVRNTIDIWIFRSKQPTLFLTFITDESSEETHLDHNSLVAEMTTKAIRSRTDLDFRLLNCVVDKETGSCEAKFGLKLKEIETQNAAFQSLTMDESKFAKAITSFKDLISANAIKGHQLITNESAVEEKNPPVRCLVAYSEEHELDFKNHVEFLEKAGFHTSPLNCKDTDTITSMDMKPYDRIDLLVDSTMCTMLKNGQQLKEVVLRTFKEIEINRTEIVLFNLFPTDDNGDDFNEVFHQVPRKVRRRPTESIYHVLLPPLEKPKAETAKRSDIRSVQVGYKNKARINPTSKQRVLVYQRGASNILNIVAPENSQLTISTRTSPDRPEIEEKIITVMKNQQEDTQKSLSGVSSYAIDKGSIVIKLDLEPGQMVTDQWLTSVLQALFTDEVCSLIPNGVSMDLEIDATVVLTGEDVSKLALDSRIHENCVSKSEVEDLQLENERLKQTISHSKALDSRIHENCVSKSEVEDLQLENERLKQTISHSKGIMATTVVYQPGMQLGKTFDLKTYTTGMSIFTEEAVSNTTKTERHVNNIKYSVVKGSSDVNNILGVSGDMSLKCKAGLVEVEGMGSYLREDRSQENTMEIIARAQVETVTESMKDESPKVGWTKNRTGTHFIRSIVYGGDLIVRIRIKGKSSKEFSDIQAKVKADLQTTGVVDAGAQAKFKKMEDELRNTSEINIEYYSTTAKGEMPRDISGMLKALGTFKDEVQQLNEGKGVPCKCEIVPLNMLDDSYPSVLKDSAFSAQMSTLEDKFDDVIIAKSKLDRFLNEDSSDMDLNEDEEGTASSLEQRIDDARQSMLQAISEIDVTSQKEAIPKINDAIKTYKEQTNRKPGGFRREVTQFLKKVSGTQTTPVEEIPKGEDLNLCLLGKTGHGKSSTANNMFGEVWSPSSSDATSGTLKCQKRLKDFTSRKICVIDTPGSMDTRDFKVALEEICTAVALRTDGYDAFLMTVRWNTKMTKEEVMAIELMKKMFGEDILMKYVIFVFTYGDTFEAEQKLKAEPRSFEEYIGSQTGVLSKYLQECNQRYVLINNLHADPGLKRQQIIKLVNMVDKLGQQNTQKKYTNKYFDQAKAAWEKIGWDSVRLNMENTSKEQNERAPEVAKEVAKEVTADGNTCFPANGKVMLENGVSIPVCQLRPGTKVLVSTTEEGGFEFSPVYLFGHIRENGTSTFIRVSTFSHSITLSPHHHIYVSMKDSLRTLSAKHVQVGFYIMVLNGDCLERRRVLSVTKVTETGLYAPFTMSGTIIVDGVLASCYVDCVPPRWAHPLLWPVRQVYKVAPSFLAWTCKSRTDGIPNWIRWCMDTIFHC